MISFDRETMTMVAAIAALAMALYVYREMQAMEARMVQPVITPMPAPPAPKVSPEEENSEEKDLE